MGGDSTPLHERLLQEELRRRSKDPGSRFYGRRVYNFLPYKPGGFPSRKTRGTAVYTAPGFLTPWEASKLLGAKG